MSASLLNPHANQIALRWHVKMDPLSQQLHAARARDISIIHALHTTYDNPPHSFIYLHFGSSIPSRSHRVPINFG
jgi:hypothetical protein